MNVQQIAVTQLEAMQALRQYKAHRNVYDRRDWEIERIYRAIARGKTVINALDAIHRAGLDELGRPKLAIMRADQEFCICEWHFSDRIIFRNVHRSKAAEWYFEIAWPNRPDSANNFRNLRARLPRIPPHLRPAQGTLSSYHVLWEADWRDEPRDPYLMRRIGKDAWVVVAAWELTDVEISVMRAHR